MDSIYYSYSEYYSDGKSISTNSLEGIWDIKCVHINVKAIYARFKIRDQIRKAQSEWKGAELSEIVWAKVDTRL